MSIHNKDRSLSWRLISIIVFGSILMTTTVIWWLYQNRSPVFHGISGSTIIVFESDEGSGKQLYAMNPDGSQVTRLTYHLNQTGWFGTSFGAHFRDLVVNQNPSIGPDMKGIYYLSNFDSGEGYQWYYLSLDGEDAVRMPSTLTDNLNTSISPNGRFIVYRTSNGNFYLYDALSRKDLCINCNRENGTVYSLPKWSPDNQRLVLSISSDIAKEGHIYIYDIAERQMTQLTKGFDNRYIEPDWSPDGTKIAFAGGKQDGKHFPPKRNIYVINVDGSNQRQLTQSGADRNPSWSPNGLQIVFQSQRGSRVSELEGIATDLFRINVDGTNEVRLIGTSGSTHYTNPVWIIVP